MATRYDIMASNEIQDLEASNGLVHGELARRADCQQYRMIFQELVTGVAAQTSPHTFQLVSGALRSNCRTCDPCPRAYARSIFDPFHTPLHHSAQVSYSITLLRAICSTSLSLSSPTPIPSSRCIFQQPVQDPLRRRYLLDPDPLAPAQKSR
jgi:hypothetical protein